MSRINLFLDTETAALAQLRPPPENVVQKGMGNRTEPAKIAEKEKANIDGWYENAPLDWRKGQLIAVGWLEEDVDEEPVIHTTEKQTEVQVLEQTWRGKWETINAIGFGVRRFDLPFLIGRSAAVGVRAPRFKLNRFRRDLGVIDLQEVLSFDAEFDLTGWSLGYYCEYFGLDTEPYGAGEDVAEWYAKGEWKNIEKHLEADILMTRDLYNFCATAFGI